MAKLMVDVRVVSPFTDVVTTNKIISINIADLSHVVYYTKDVIISTSENNIIKNNPDGVYAEIKKSDNILSFSTAFENAIKK